MTQVFPGDRDRKLERPDEADLADLPRCRFGEEQVVVLERSLEDRARMACEVDVGWGTLFHCSAPDRPTTRTHGAARLAGA